MSTGRSTLAGLAVAAVLGSSLALGMATPASAEATGDDSCAPGNVQYTPLVPAALGVLQSDLTWTRATGAGVLVAVVDSGIDGGNEHLASAVVGGVDLVGDGENGSGLSDPNGHGTAIAGQIAARPVSGSGVVGLAPDAQLLSVRVFRAEDDEARRLGFGPSIEKLAAGIRYAADAGAQVINVSLSHDVDGGGLRESVDYAASRGSLVVTSAGNRATASNTTDGPRYPGAYDGALAVAATNAAGVVTNDSIHGPHVEIAAPGGEVLTAATGAGDCQYANEAPSTSFATAYVSAAAALVAQAHPDESPAQWAYRLQATAVRSNPDQRDDNAGWGIVQPYNAITLLPDASTRGPANPFVEATGTVVVPPVVEVVPDHGASPFEVTRATMVLVAVAAATILGALGVALTIRRRRVSDARQEAEPDLRPGLLNKPKT